MDFKKAWENLKDKLMVLCDSRSDRIKVDIDYKFLAFKKETERELQILYEIKDAMDTIEFELSRKRQRKKLPKQAVREE